MQVINEDNVQINVQGNLEECPSETYKETKPKKFLKK